jgi:hypothetical protein
MNRTEIMTSEQFREALNNGSIKVGTKGKLKDKGLKQLFRDPMKLPTTENKRVRNAKKVLDIEGNVIADSKLEFQLKSALQTLKINFTFQEKFILIPKCYDRYTKKNIQETSWTIDFVFKEKKVAVDCKGWTTEIAKLKMKLFRSIFSEWDIIFVKNLNELMKAIEFINNKKN